MLRPSAAALLLLLSHFYPAQPLPLQGPAISFTPLSVSLSLTPESCLIDRTRLPGFLS